MGYHNAQVSILDLNSGQITQLTEGLTGRLTRSSGQKLQPGVDLIR